jgi:CxxC-x17-CxxC domain-containing protein
MLPTDAVLSCRDCGGSISISDEERRFFAALDHVHPPSRCPACREARKTRQAERGTGAVAPGFRELRQTWTTIVCNSCGESAVVPFVARPGRSVYCTACFQRRRLESET